MAVTVADSPAVGSDRRFLLGLVALLGVPLLLGALALRRPPWAPVLDLAMTEVRVRDVGTTETPLVGLPGRIERAGQQGSHPGPLSFWLLAPIYRLLGSTSWALQVAAGALNLLGMSVAVVLAHRRAGRLGAVVAAVCLSLLVLGYGLGPVLEPWNPYLPMLWWVVVLLALWSVLDGDHAALLVLVAAGSYCAQTHVPYLLLCVVLGGLGITAVALRAWREPSTRRSATRWLAATVVLGAVLWTPPTIDQLTSEPGNYAILVDHFATPSEDAIGLRRAGTEVLGHFDLGHLVADQVVRPGRLTRGEPDRFPVAWRGGLLLVAWAAAAAWAWTRSPAALRALHGVVAVATVLAWVSISRIFGLVWFYLTLWLWAVALLATVATVWSLLVRARSRPGRASPRAAMPAAWRRVGAVPVLVTVLGALSLRLALAAPDAEPTDAHLTVVLGELVGPVADALEQRTEAADGAAERYLVGFTDALHIGSQAYGLVSELERRGFDAGMEPPFAVPITAHRTLTVTEATARLQLVTGLHVEEWRARSDAVELAHVDPLGPAQRDRLDALRTSVEARLVEEGLAEVVPLLDTNLFAAAIDPRASDGLRVEMDRMLRLGAPTSVFLVPISQGYQ
jgi:hypothetical protein